MGQQAAEPDSSKNRNAIAAILKRAKKFLLSIIKEAPGYLGKKLLDYGVGIAIASVAVAVWLYFFPHRPAIQLGQSGLGDHCPNDVFQAAEAAGIKLEFTPSMARHMAICGPASYSGKNIDEGLSGYLLTLQSPCFRSEIFGRTVKLSPNLKGDMALVGNLQVAGAAVVNNYKGREIWTCRCDPRQIPLLLERGAICGMTLN